MKVLLKLPLINQRIRDKIREQLVAAFGGQFYEIIIGGAAFNSEIENFLYKMNFNYTVGYGATECAPIITYADWHERRLGSCGRVVPHMEIKIDSKDPQRIVGEILVRGANVMLGYYKNPEATEAAIDKDGWFHTGDLGVIDADGFLYIRGRSKNIFAWLKRAEYLSGRDRREIEYPALCSRMYCHSRRRSTLWTRLSG